MNLLRVRLMKRTFISTIILTFGLTSAIAQKMDTPSIIGKWSSIDTVNKKRMTFYFGDDLKASMLYGGKSIPFTYPLTSEDSKQLLTIITTDKKIHKIVIRFRSEKEFELFTSKNVDFKNNITLWGLNEFIVLTKEY